MEKEPKHIKLETVDPTIDFVFHKLMGSPDQKPLLLDLINSVLGLEGADCLFDLEIVNPFNEEDFESNKLGVVDIKAVDLEGNLYQMEIQTTIPRDLKERMVYTFGSIVSAQLMKGENYEQLRRVNAIWILTRNLWPRKRTRAAHMKFVMYCHEEKLTLADDQAIHVIQLKNEADDAKLNKRLRLWIRFFSKRATGILATFQNGCWRMR